MALTPASLSCLWLLTWFGPLRDEALLLMLAGLTAATQFSGDPANWIIFGRGRIDVGACLLIVDRLGYLAGLYCGAYLWPCAEGLVTGSLCANLVRMLLAQVIALKWFDIRLKGAWDAGLFKSLLASSVYGGAAILAFVAYGQCTLILARLIASPEQLGVYAIAFGTTNSLAVIPTALTTALFPAMAARSAPNDQEKRGLYWEVAQLNLAVSIPLAACLIAFPQESLRVWIGGSSEEMIQSLRFSALALPFLALNFMYRLYTFAVHKTIIEFLASLVGMALFVGLGPLVYQAHGGVGLSLLYVCTEMALVLIKSAALIPSIGFPPFLPGATRMVAVGVAAVAAAWMTARYPWWLRGGVFSCFMGLHVVGLSLAWRRRGASNGKHRDAPLRLVRQILGLERRQTPSVESVGEHLVAREPAPALAVGSPPAGENQPSSTLGDAKRVA